MVNISDSFLRFDNKDSISKGKEIIYSAKIDSPIGIIYAFSTNNGVCTLEFFQKQRLEKCIKSLKSSYNAGVIEEKNTHLKQLKEELGEYFAGKRKMFDVSLDLSGTEFQKSVWNSLLDIPFGKIQTYEQQAIKLNSLSAIRAIAAANGQNKISIVIPCHRVIGKSGNLTGYAGGLHRKKWLLDFEKSASGQMTQKQLDF